MACRPARRITNTNGVVFQTSAITSAENAAFGSPSHDTGEARMPVRTNKLFKTPYWSLKIHAHKTAITAVGNVQGIKRMVRTAPMPRIQSQADKISPTRELGMKRIACIDAVQADCKRSQSGIQHDRANQRCRRDKPDKPPGYL